MIAWAIYPTPEPGSSDAFDWMTTRAKESGVELRILFAENFSILLSFEESKILYNGEELDFPHFVLMRHYDFNLSMAMERMGILVVNSGESMQLSQNKFLTHTELLCHGIPTPLTLYRETDYDRCVEMLGSPFILKAVRGSKGMEVFLIHSNDEFLSCQRLLSDWIAQKYIASSCGRDLRVWVIGDQAVATVLRCSDTSFKSNIALGARAERFEADDTVKQLAVDACQAVGLQLAGVDILFDESGYTVCEVNGNAGFRAFGLSGSMVDIPDLIFKYIVKDCC